MNQYMINFLIFHQHLRKIYFLIYGFINSIMEVREHVKKIEFFTDMSAIRGGGSTLLVSISDNMYILAFQIFFFSFLSLRKKYIFINVFMGIYCYFHSQPILSSRNYPSRHVFLAS